MPTATLTFSLPEEQPEFNTTVKANDMAVALIETNELFRTLLKYSVWPDNTEVTPEEDKVIERLRDQFFVVINDNNLNEIVFG